MYYIYGKRTQPLLNLETHKWMGPDKTFRPIDYAGVRVYKKADAKTFETKEEAQDFLNKRGKKKGVVFEIRKG